MLQSGTLFNGVYWGWMESLKGLFKRLKKCLEDNVKNMSVMDFKDE